MSDVQFPSKAGVPFPYDHEMRMLLSRGLRDFHPWHFLDVQRAEETEEAMLNDGFRRSHILLAHRIDGDETVATFNTLSGKINVVNCIDTVEGEIEAVFDGFWEFFHYASAEMIAFGDCM